MKTIAWLALIGTLMAGLYFMIVSLNDWEWNRVLFFALVVVIAEIALATALILRRLPPRDSSRSTPSSSRSSARRNQRIRIGLPGCATRCARPTCSSRSSSQEG